MLVFAGV